ncbi:hypothetical protein BIW11_09565 [Tropilaelaps mercedesae]|uniref:Uncharacterized protein n=1 Tax=Tropilaelaps mercedesae TaxID=418985 RepID=A0A1V9XJT4_9ACAR|nr:hypothetical protein BIW11_09565 [Tropilaelaps mercedesae]
MLNSGHRLLGQCDFEWYVDSQTGSHVTLPKKIGKTSVESPAGQHQSLLEVPATSFKGTQWFRLHCSKMLRASTEWYSSQRDDTNPFFEDEIYPKAYTSHCARLIFCGFRYVCLAVLYVVLAFAAIFIVLALYGFAHFSLFEGGLIECFDQNEKVSSAFQKHHIIRLSLEMMYGLCMTAFALIATRISKFNKVTKVFLTALALVTCLICVVGNIQEIVWSLPFTNSTTCSYDWYVLWLYRAWPWYTTTLFIFAIFIGMKYLEKTKFTKPHENS